ncbi:uncharacterized protein METZ01_LOCUS284322, partial [marine metagenome]
VLDGLAANDVGNNGRVESEVRAKVETLCAAYPIY